MLKIIASECVHSQMPVILKGVKCTWGLLTSLFDFQLLNQDQISSFCKQKLAIVSENPLWVPIHLLWVYRLGLKFFCKSLIISPKTERGNSVLLPGPYASLQAYCWLREASPDNRRNVKSQYQGFLIPGSPFSLPMDYFIMFLCKWAQAWVYRKWLKAGKPSDKNQKSSSAM